MSIKAIRALYAEAKSAGMSYILTSRLNNDALENFFSQIRGLGGPNSHPGAANAVCRVRTLLLGKEPQHIVQRPVVAHADDGEDVPAPVLPSEDEFLSKVNC